MINQNIEEQRNRAIEMLSELKDQMDSTDRLAVSAETGVAYITIHRYLNGKVSKVSIATKLIEAIQKRVDSRKAVLA